MTGRAPRLLWPALALEALAAAYLGSMTALAVTGKHVCRVQATRNHPRLAVIVPAHNEEHMLPGLLHDLSLQTYPRERYEVHVIADNCRDATAAIARAQGARVYERHDEAHRGKGQALAWLLPQLLEADVDAFVFLDADSAVEPQFLQVMASHLEIGELVLQASYGVARPDASSQVALRALAFTLMHDVRGRAKSRLGVSCGLWGNGMAMHRSILETAAGWHSFSSVEDAEQHLRLVLAGKRVAFVPEVRVRGFMPATYEDASGQQQRWEAGRLSLLRAWWRPLLGSALRQRNRSAAIALCDLALPPLSVVGLTTAAGFVGSWLFGGPRTRLVASLSAAGLAAHLIAGLALSGLRPRSYLALLELPRFAAWKVWLYGREIVRRKDSPWTRTPR